MTPRQRPPLRVGIVVPHIFMHHEILPNVIFAPAKLSINLSEGLQSLGANVTLFSPGPVNTSVRNITGDLSYFELELRNRGYSYIALLKKHPVTFISLARQLQGELIAKAYAAANDGELDIVHIYTNEEDIALSFARLCRQPTVFTHHDPFNFLIRYKSIFPKYSNLNWLSISMAQRRAMPADTNWAGNIYHGLDEGAFKPIYQPKDPYIAYLGRIIEPKGVHLAIQAVKLHNAHNKKKYRLKIAGKHYAGMNKDTYWQARIKPEIDGNEIEYVGFIKKESAKQDFLGNAEALIVPSTFEEPFGVVMIEALACGTPIIGLDSGAISEIVLKSHTGLLVEKVNDDSGQNTKIDEQRTALLLTDAIKNIHKIDRMNCRRDFEKRFTLQRMCREHLAVYENLIRE